LLGGVHVNEFDSFHELIAHEETCRLGVPGYVDGLGAGLRQLPDNFQTTSKIYILIIITIKKIISLIIILKFYIPFLNLPSCWRPF
jgi:hypothetical protein